VQNCVLHANSDDVVTRLALTLADEERTVTTLVHEHLLCLLPSDRAMEPPAQVHKHYKHYTHLYTLTCPPLSFSPATFVLIPIYTSVYLPFSCGIGTFERLFKLDEVSSSLAQTTSILLVEHHQLGQRGKLIAAIQTVTLTRVLNLYVRDFAALASVTHHIVRKI
jgi:hypothetical protein